MTNRILVLDDLEERHNRFDQILKNHEVVHVWTADDFFVACERQGPFHLICLDHDLGDNPEIEPTRIAGMYNNSELTGHDCTWWLTQNKWLAPKKILIHSVNPAGATRMLNTFNAGLPDVFVRWIPFQGKP